MTSLTEQQLVVLTFLASCLACAVAAEAAPSAADETVFRSTIDELLFVDTWDFEIAETGRLWP
jgi:hypothetical protein